MYNQVERKSISSDESDYSFRQLSENDQMLKEDVQVVPVKDSRDYNNLHDQLNANMIMHLEQGLAFFQYKFLSTVSA